MATAVLFLLILESRVSSLNQVSSIEVFKLFYLWIIAAFLVVLFAYDLRHYILPDKMLFPAIGIVLVYRVFEVLNLNNWSLFGPPAGGFEFRILAMLLPIFQSSFSAQFWCVPTNRLFQDFSKAGRRIW